MFAGYCSVSLELEQIPLAARITTVVDVFDALTTERSYKKAWTEEEALNELIAKKGKAFDPDVVDAFASLHKEGYVSDIRRRYP